MPGKIRTHYDNLQIAENASPEVIKGAYRYLSQKWHPDKNPSNRGEAERITKVINEAYAVLSDPDSRREHDRWIAEQRQMEKGVGDEPDLQTPMRGGEERDSLFEKGGRYEWAGVAGGALVLVAVFGIILASAIPAFNDYGERARKAGAESSLAQDIVRRANTNSPEMVNEITRFDGAGLEGDQMVYRYTLFQQNAFNYNSAQAFIIESCKNSESIYSAGLVIAHRYFLPSGQELGAITITADVCKDPQSKTAWALLADIE